MELYSLAQANPACLDHLSYGLFYCLRHLDSARCYAKVQEWPRQVHDYEEIGDEF